MGAISIKDRLAQKRGAIAANKSKGIRTYKWKPGKTLFRIIPPTDGSMEFDRRFGKMWLKSFDGQQKFSIGDRDITFGESDPIKDMIFRAMREAPNEEVRDHYKDMLAATKHVFQVYIISVNGAPDPDAPADQPQIVEVSETQFDKILGQFEVYSDMDETHDLASKDRGHVFMCEKAGTGFDTTYTFAATPRAMPLTDAQVLAQHDIDAWIQGEFEGLEAKAVEFLGKLNGAAGITVAVNAGLLRGTGSNAAAPAQIASTAQTDAATNVSSATVTKIIDAEIEEIPDTTPPFDTGVTAATTVEVVATPEPTPAATPAATLGTSEIDDILAGLQ